MALQTKTLLLSRPQAVTESSGAFDLGACRDWAIQIVYAALPSAAACASATDISVANDTFTKTAHGFPTGLKVQVTTSTTLPTGISALTDYWVIKVDADTFKLATSLANADAGTAVNITAAGTGTQTVTPTAGTLAHSAQVEKSVDGSNWKAEGSATAISATGNAILEGASKGYRYLRVTNTVTTGQAVYTVSCSAK